MSDFTIHTRWFWGLVFGVGHHCGRLFICLGPVQFEIEHDPVVRDDEWPA